MLDLKLFKLTRQDCDYDEYDCFIVVAPDKETALLYNPVGLLIEDNSGYCDWPHGDSIESLEVEELTDYTGDEPIGTVLCASFNAG